MAAVRLGAAYWFFDPKLGPKPRRAEIWSAAPGAGYWWLVADGRQAIEWPVHSTKLFPSESEALAAWRDKGTTITARKPTEKEAAS